jgi:hypothetical protein
VVERKVDDRADPDDSSYLGYNRMYCILNSELKIQDNIKYT